MSDYRGIDVPADMVQAFKGAEAPQETPTAAPEAPVESPAPAADATAPLATPEPLEAKPELAPEPPQDDRYKAVINRERDLYQKQMEVKKQAESLKWAQQAQEAMASGNYMAAAEAIAQQAGVEGDFYDKLTEQKVRGGEPDIDPKIRAQEDRLAKLEQEREEARAEASKLRHLDTIKTTLGASEDDYELVKGFGYQEVVYNRILTHYNESGDELSIADAAALVEQDLREEADKIAQTLVATPKAQARLVELLKAQGVDFGAPKAPEPTPEPVSQATASHRPTLTNEIETQAPPRAEPTKLLDRDLSIQQLAEKMKHGALG